MCERHRAGVAEQQIVRRHQQREDADFRGDVHRLGAGKQKRRQREQRYDDNEQKAENSAARRIAGKDHHRFVTG